MFTPNEHRLEFKKLLLRQLEKMEPGHEITDEKLMELIKENEIEISLLEAMAVVRDLEDSIGKLYRIRLKRIRGKGYLCLEPREQVNFAVAEGGRKIKRACKKTAKRLRHVNHEKLTAEERKELAYRVMGVDSLLNIIEGTVNSNRLLEEKTKLLDTTETTLRAMELFN